jgi:8-oxo-dGTP pyrophosphatase MutT (NUDIX family)
MPHKDFKKVDDPDDVGLHRNSDVPLGDNIISGVPLPGGAGKSMREAAVLIPLVQHDANWHLLFIRRAKNEHDRHSGQVAFPGGAQDAADHSLEATALREAQEEIGLAAERIKLLGQLEPYITISHYRVTAVVGVVQWPSALTLQNSEVARAFLMPLAWLRNRQNFSMRARQDMDPHSARRHPIIVFDEYDGETLWGATARMTLNFIRALDEQQIRLPDSSGHTS